MSILNSLIIKTLPIVPKSVVHIFAKKYIAGDTLEDAVRVTNELGNEGAWTTIDALGEFVTSREKAIEEKKHCSHVLEAIVRNSLKTYLSVKPTSLGLGIDLEFAYDNISEIVSKAAENGVFVRLDMENSPYTTNTLNTYRRLRDNGFDNVGIVLQSYMRRSENDLADLMEYKPNIRLCKGIYNEAPEIAYKNPDEIRNSYKRLLVNMLENGLYVGIATHDEPLIQFAVQTLQDMKLPKNKYEFQMLLGVREDRRREIINNGNHLRVYVPFGEDWYGYSTRRLKENPNMAGHIFKSFFIKN